ncbi:MAG: peptidyl-prolyl cis-trans isomerase [Elainellaceae cyanobacterium]
MTDFESVALLKVGNQTISLAQALQYLQRSGKLMPFINEIVGQHILAQEVQSHTDLAVGVAELENRVLEFRKNQALDEPQKFEEWLSSRGLTYGAFHNLLTDDLKVEKLRAQVSEETASTYFAENHGALDEIKLTYIAVTDRAKVDELRQRIDSSAATFDEIATECLNAAFLNQDSDISLKKETVRRGQLRSELSDLLAERAAGDIVGPIEVGDRWWLLKIEAIEQAAFEGDLKQKLEIELFRQWLTQRMQAQPIQLMANS